MVGTAAKWAERVRGWRASGKTAEEFASGFEFEASTLRYWASRLKKEAAAPTKASPTLVRVVRRRPRPESRTAVPADARVPTVEVLVGPGRIVVGRGFDAELLRQVAAALGGAR